MCWHIALAVETVMDDSYISAIVALLPLAAIMLTVQVNPYHALVIRGILGAIATLVYIVLGAADVALTEALVGTMLAITLYAVAVRSSFVMRVGVLEHTLSEIEDTPKNNSFSQVIAKLRSIASKYHLRLELISYPNSQLLQQALLNKEVHATCAERSLLAYQGYQLSESEEQPYQTITRIRRLYEILQTELSSTTSLAYVTPADLEEKH
jgi:putative multicomponent Na+:H+ antiporter subunit B